LRKGKKEEKVILGASFCFGALWQKYIPKKDLTTANILDYYQKDFITKGILLLGCLHKRVSICLR
jgi:hypothetical protein